MIRSYLVKQEILEAFGDVPRPDLIAISQLGWCEDHDPGFDWYRHHTWREFERELPSERFDPFEFSFLHPSAYHYFVPGLLLATLNSIVTSTDSFHLWKGDWVHNLTPLKSSVDRFTQEYLPLFAPSQTEAVGNHLKFFNEWNTKRRGYGVDDIQRAINQIRQAKT